MNIFGSLKEKITQYADVYLKLLKLNFIGRTASVMGYFMFAMICLFFIFCTMLLLGLGIVEAFCAMGLSRVASFFITLGIYVLFLFIFVSMRRRVTNFFAGLFIRMLTDENDATGND